MSPPPISSAAIIGAGPTGLACARSLLSLTPPPRIVIYDLRPAPGGVWSSLPPPPAPPLYPGLETNIPRDLMAFSTLAWPAGTQLFPRATQVCAYVARYAAGLEGAVRLGTVVERVRRGAAGWVVTTAAAGEEGFDAVVVASGHYAVQAVPSWPGLAAWPAAEVRHSLDYEGVQAYAGCTVLVVGNGASGTDIASQLAGTAGRVLLSGRGEGFSPPDPRVECVPAVEEFLPERGRGVRFVDGSVREGVDRVLLCTGYRYAFPWLELDTPVVDEAGMYVKGLYQHLFLRSDPTIAFPGLVQKVVPFPVAEVQAAVLAGVWSGKLSLPGEEEMRKWEEELLSSVKRDRDVHTLGFPKDAGYINFMAGWAGKAAATGKTPPTWGERACWLRERFPAIKRAFQDRGEGRHNVTTVEELGFDFEEWKREQEGRNNEEGSRL